MAHSQLALSVALLQEKLLQHSENKQPVCSTLSTTLNSIWLSGSAPSRLSQRSRTKSVSASTSFRGSVKEPRAWPQLWESYKETKTYK